MSCNSTSGFLFCVYFCYSSPQFRLTTPFFCFSAFYLASFFGASSLKSSAAKITAKPTPICGVTFSPSSRQENSTPNTDSSDSRITACEAGAMLWPMFCRLMPMVVENTAIYSSPPTEPRLNVIGMPRSKIRLYTAAYSPQNANCSTISA